MAVTPKFNPWAPTEEEQQILPGQSRVEKPEETSVVPETGTPSPEMGPIPTGDLAGMRNQAASRAFTDRLRSNSRAFTEPLHRFDLNNQIADAAQPFGRFQIEGYNDAYSTMLDSELASEDISFRGESEIDGERAIIFETNAVGNFEDDEIGIYYPESGDTEYMSPQEYEDLMNPGPQDTGYSDTGDTGGY